ncbi:MAG: hypothetical protein PGN16_03875 [Sphingomonas phyllosphaerae]|uniref:hypothetical protein n=1 Tax=Sphingomonas phyllosphaerae TaxID=257003 RepID=UPI002FF9D317
MSAPEHTARAGKQAQASTVSMARMMGLTTAAGMLGGQDRLADALSIQPRSLRAKLSAERGISNDDLIATADALDERIRKIADHSFKLREEAHAAESAGSEPL